MTYLGTMEREDHNALWSEWQDRCKKPGDFFFEHDQGALWIAIPNVLLSGQAHFTVCRWPVNGKKLDNGAGWDWDGNVEKPTMNPSLYALKIWHGWVRNGRLESC